MSYQLGVDVGTTYTSASVFVDGRADIVPLGNRSTSIPSDDWGVTPTPHAGITVWLILRLGLGTT